MDHRSCWNKKEIRKRCHANIVTCWNINIFMLS